MTMKVTLTILLTSLLLAACSETKAQSDGNAKAEIVARGKYLVSITGCNDCHTPLKAGVNGPEPDMSRMLSGHPQDVIMPAPSVQKAPWGSSASVTNTAFAGPWGVSYSFNLTPDEVTGIGIWSEDIFVKTIRTGRHWGTSRPILPPMPWQSFNEMTDDDLRAVFAYLRTIPAVSNQVPDPIIVGQPVTQ
jgi:mono/diheme cytochrome c family protein